MLAESCREEANEEVKLKAIAALGCWLSRMSQWNAAALDRMAAGMKEKDTLRHCHLQALNKVYSSTDWTPCMKLHLQGAFRH